MDVPEIFYKNRHIRGLLISDLQQMIIQVYHQVQLKVL